MANVITHQGIVENIMDTRVFVRIIQTSACAHCSVKGHCTSADTKEKVIEVDAAPGLYKVGEVVTVIGQTSMGLQAVVLAFVIPFFILILFLFVCMHVTDGDEPLSALISLALLIPYYFMIWLIRAKLKKKFSFTIKSNK